MLEIHFTILKIHFTILELNFTILEIHFTMLVFCCFVFTGGFDFAIKHEFNTRFPQLFS